MEPDLVIFTYAPAGLGHMRVIDALMDSMPFNSPVVLLGGDDTNMVFIHRLMSTNPFLKKVMEWFQKGYQEKVFANLYGFILTMQTGALQIKLLHILKNRYPKSKNILIVCSHFGLAHQIAHIKSIVEKICKVKITLCVQVTDATSMKIWYVPNSDIMFVPSRKVKNELDSYAKSFSSQVKPLITVSPYPISEILSKKLTRIQYKDRLSQVNHTLKTRINIVIPISGAAVGLIYYKKLIDSLTLLSDKYYFHVVGRSDITTMFFLESLRKNKNVKIYSSIKDKDVVDLYEKIYKENIISIEIVKPSEQSFKALATPRERGGAILLFVKPVGKQEYDNLDFLTNHKLIPTKDKNNKIINSLLNHSYELNNFPFRGMALTNDVATDTRIIDEALKYGVFRSMCYFVYPPQTNFEELGSSGVNIFWKKVEDFLKEKTKEYSQS